MNENHVKILTDWLNAGYAGQMGYMYRNLAKRINPAKLLPHAQSVIVVGLNYTPPADEKRRTKDTEPTGRLANFARYEDYHYFIKRQLRKLAVFISETVSGGFTFRICVDSAPIAERALAVRAGLGFIGKNHILTNLHLGNQILLGELITSIKLKTDQPIRIKCSACNKCIAACPTGALRPDGQFDAGKCISYLTIEHKGEIPADLAKKMGDWLFGCDLCALACPYQQNAPVCTNKDFRYFEGRDKINLHKIIAMSQEDFNSEYKNTCIERLGLERLKRNAKICLANIDE